MSNYNDKKKSFNSESYSYKNINEHRNKSPVEDEEIRIIGTNPAISTSFSPIGKNIVIPQTNRFIERKTDHNRQYCVKPNSSYYQTKPATYLLYDQPQPAKCNQRQNYCQDRITQQAFYKNDYDRDKVGKHDNIIVEYLHLKKKYPLFH